MKSDLPVTGRCHFCDKPVDGKRFCRGTSCQRLYHYRKTHPEVKYYPPRLRKRAVQYTDNGTDWDAIQARIDRIAARQRAPS